MALTQWRQNHVTESARAVTQAPPGSGAVSKHTNKNIDFGETITPRRTLHYQYGSKGHIKKIG